jgi:hypothetical protein
MMAHIVGQLYGVPHGILRVFSTIFYENEFQNPQIFQQTISLFPEHSTLVSSALLHAVCCSFSLLMYLKNICPAARSSSFLHRNISSLNIFLLSVPLLYYRVNLNGTDDDFSVTGL